MCSEPRTSVRADFRGSKHVPQRSDRYTKTDFAIGNPAELATVVEGKPDITRLSEIDLESLGRKFRLQKVVFETARDIYDQMKPG